MKVVTWNVRGLGRREKRGAVRKLLKKDKFSIVMLQESKLNEVNVGLLGSLWGNRNMRCEVAAATGSTGGLIIAWDENFFSLQNCFVNSRFILLKGEIKKVNLECGIGNIYTPNDDMERAAFWEELGQALNNLDVPWCIGGDFNVVRTPDEKIGAVLNQGAMSLLSDFIENMGLMDLPLQGGRFTWCNNRENPTFCRLDRFLVNHIFLEKFPSLVQSVLPRSLSDHSPVIIANVEADWGLKPFKFFNFWLEEEGFRDMVKGLWSRI